MKVLLLMSIVWMGNHITAVKTEYGSVSDCKAGIKTIVDENPKMALLKSKSFQCVKVVK